jgi:hypothetical protein
MKKLLVFCLFIFLVSCKDKDKDSAVDPDYAPAFVGTYNTATVDGNTTTIQNWEVINTDKNILAINYTKTTKVSVSGTEATIVQVFPLVDVKVTAEDSFTINEVVDVKQNTPGELRQKLEGTATKVTNGTGAAQLNITIRYTTSSTGKAEEKYLEFKKSN